MVNEFSPVSHDSINQFLQKSAGVSLPPKLGSFHSLSNQGAMLLGPDLHHASIDQAIHLVEVRPDLIEFVPDPTKPDEIIPPGVSVHMSSAHNGRFVAAKYVFSVPNNQWLLGEVAYSGTKNELPDPRQDGISRASAYNTVTHFAQSVSIYETDHTVSPNCIGGHPGTFTHGMRLATDHSRIMSLRFTSAQKGGASLVDQPHFHEPDYHCWDEYAPPVLSPKMNLYNNGLEIKVEDDIQEGILHLDLGQSNYLLIPRSLPSIQVQFLSASSNSLP